MAKIITRENYRLEVSLKMGYRRTATHDELMRGLKKLQESIKRHVDDVGEITRTCDARLECEFCGSAWEIWEEKDEAESGYKKGMPVCCAAAQEEFKAKTS